jgi:DNA mismatch repair ATPase MutS
MLKLLEFENKKANFSQLSLVDTIKPKIEIIEKEVFKDSIVEQKLKKIDLNNLTPMEALNLLNELKTKINGD